MTLFDDKHGTRVFSKDEELEQVISKMSAEMGMAELAEKFPFLLRRTWLKKFFAHYEIFRSISKVKGDVVELGVFRGLSLFSFALFNEFSGGEQRTIYGIDNFSGFTDILEEDGEAFDVPKVEGGFSPARYLDDLMAMVQAFNSSAENTEICIVKGNVEDVLGDVTSRLHGLALVHFDVDLYKPTLAGLEAFFPLLSDGGAFIFDEYACQEWAGETKAVDDYFRGKSVKLQKFEWQGAPTAFLIK